MNMFIHHETYLDLRREAVLTLSESDGSNKRMGEYDSGDILVVETEIRFTIEETMRETTTGCDCNWKRREEKRGKNIILYLHYQSTLSVLQCTIYQWYSSLIIIMNG